MDLLRSCYQTRMRFQPSDPPEGFSVRWYFCDPGVGPLPYRHVFGSRNWDRFKGLVPVLGQIPVAPKPWRDGENIVPEEHPPSCTTEFEWFNGSLTSTGPMPGFVCCGGWGGYGRLGLRAGVPAALGLRAFGAEVGGPAHLGFRGSQPARLGLRGYASAMLGRPRLGCRGFGTVTVGPPRLGLQGPSLASPVRRVGMRASNAPATVSNACCSDVARTLYVRFTEVPFSTCPGVGDLVITLLYQDTGADAGKWVGSGSPAGSTGGDLNVKFYCDGTGVGGWRIAASGCTTGWFANAPNTTYSTCSPFKVRFDSLLVEAACCGGGFFKNFDVEVKDV